MFTRQRPGAVLGSLLVASTGLLLAISTGLQSCANVQVPPGGPPDSIPPLLIAVVPDSYAVMPGFRDEVRFEFDEAISERGVEGSVVLYPFERPRIKKGKRELKVRPREGWIADRIYHMRVEPVIQDLFQNPIKEPIDYIFSTGVPIPENRVQGVVFDRITGRPATDGRVDMVLMPDTLRYGGTTDSVGGFGLATLPVGDFLAIGYQDVNGNKRADEFDRSDTLEVTLSAVDTLTLEFQIFRHDTVGPRLALANAVDSMIVEVEFDGYLHPDSLVSTDNITVFAEVDSTSVAIDTVLHAWQFTAWRDSVEQVRRAIADSIAAAAADSARAAADTAGAADTAQAAPDTLPVVPDSAQIQQVIQPERPVARPRPEAPGLEAAVPEAEQEEEEEPARLPDRKLYVVARARIPAGTHVVRGQNIFNLAGLAGGGEATFEPVEPEPEAEGEPPPPPPPPSPPGPRDRPGPLPGRGSEER